MSDCNPVHVPGIGKEPSAQPEERAPLNETISKLYQAIVGSLIFLTQRTRYDVASSTMQAACHISKPTSVYMAVVKRIVRYLRGTPNLAIMYERDSSFNLTGYCDASYGMGDRTNMRSRLPPDGCFLGLGTHQFFKSASENHCSKHNRSGTDSSEHLREKWTLPIRNPWGAKMAEL